MLSNGKWEKTGRRNSEQNTREGKKERWLRTILKFLLNKIVKNLREKTRQIGSKSEVTGSPSKRYSCVRLTFNPLRPLRTDTRCFYSPLLLALCIRGNYSRTRDPEITADNCPGMQETRKSHIDRTQIRCFSAPWMSMAGSAWPGSWAQRNKSWGVVRSGVRWRNVEIDTSPKQRQGQTRSWILHAL